MIEDSDGPLLRPLIPERDLGCHGYAPIGIWSGVLAVIHSFIYSLIHSFKKHFWSLAHSIHQVLAVLILEVLGT